MGILDICTIKVVLARCKMVADGTESTMVGLLIYDGILKGMNKEACGGGLVPIEACLIADSLNTMNLFVTRGTANTFKSAWEDIKDASPEYVRKEIASWLIAVNLSKVSGLPGMSDKEDISKAIKLLKTGTN